MDPDIRLVRLEGASETRGGQHSRRPDLSARIKSIFPGVEYIGEYITHGQSKTVFGLSRSNPPGGAYEGGVLKVACTMDSEPHVFRHTGNWTPNVWYECMGHDGS